MNTQNGDNQADRVSRLDALSKARSVNQLESAFVAVRNEEPGIKDDESV